MEANVAEAEFIHGTLELRLAVVANQSAGIVRSHGEIEKAIDGAGCMPEVGHDKARCSLLGISRKCECENSDKQGKRKPDNIPQP